MVEGGVGVQAKDGGSGAGPIFVSFREVRGPPLKAPYGKKPICVKRYYLIDIHGNETLAAFGEDQGDAHYIYQNVANFTRYGTLECHNRKELTAWLDRVKRDSQEANNFHLVEDHPDYLDLSPVGSPQHMSHQAPFVAYRQEKFEYPDGHRGQKWFLVDESGHEQLAVVAEERETRDGHYIYKAEGPLAQQHPEVASNMSVVSQWLDGVLLHPMSPHPESPPRRNMQPARVGSPGGQRKTKPHPPQIDHFPTQTLKKSTGKRADALHTEDPKRSRMQAQDAEMVAKEQVVHLVREQAVAEGRRRKEAREAALMWLQDDPTEEQVEHAESWLARLNAAVADMRRFDDDAAGGLAPMETDRAVEPSNGGVGEVEGAPSRTAALLDTLEALREVGATHFNNQLMQRCQVVKTIQGLLNHKEGSVARLAQTVMERLTAVTLRHTLVLTDPLFREDPLQSANSQITAMESMLAARQSDPGSLVKGIAAQLGNSATPLHASFPFHPAHGLANMPKSASGAAAQPHAYAQAPHSLAHHPLATAHAGPSGGFPAPSQS